MPVLTGSRINPERQWRTVSACATDRGVLGRTLNAPRESFIDWMVVLRSAMLLVSETLVVFGTKGKRGAKGVDADLPDAIAK